MTVSADEDAESPPSTEGRFGYFVNFLAVSIVFLAAAWSLDLPRQFGMAFYPAQFLSLVLGLAICVAYLTRSFRATPILGYLRGMI